MSKKGAVTNGCTISAFSNRERLDSTRYAWHTERIFPTLGGPDTGSGSILQTAFQEPTDELPVGNLYLNSMCYAEGAFSDIDDWRGRILILETPN